MENQFLVRANIDLYRPLSNTRCITKGNVYLANKIDTVTITIADSSDPRNRHLLHGIQYFDIIEFVDIWEMKRNGNSLSS